MQTSFIFHGHEKISLDRKENNGVGKTLFLIPLINHHSRKTWGIKIINPAQKIDCRAFVSE